MSIYVPWLADAARMTGYPVVEEAGWRSRGRYGFRVVEGVVGHHTAGPATGEYPCRSIILNGRSGLPGPLANFGLGRSGTIYVVAAGVANHAGDSAYAGFTDLNDEFLGIEAEDDGDGNWTSEQIDCYPRLVAACLYYMKRPATRYGGHKNVAIPTGRKVDPAGIDTAWMQSKVHHYLTYPNQIGKSSMPTDAELDTWVVGAIRERWLFHGGMTGRLGKPLTKELATADGVGRYNHFERGSIFYHPSTGARAIWGGFRDAYAKLNWAEGILGYPKTEEQPHPEGAMQDFTGGVLTWNSVTGDIWHHYYVLG